MCSSFAHRIRNRGFIVVVVHSDTDDGMALVQFAFDSAELLALVTNGLDDALDPNVEGQEVTHDLGHVLDRMIDDPVHVIGGVADESLSVGVGGRFVSSGADVRSASHIKIASAIPGLSMPLQAGLSPAGRVDRVPQGRSVAGWSTSLDNLLSLLVIGHRDDDVAVPVKRGLVWQGPYAVARRRSSAA